MLDLAIERSWYSRKISWRFFRGVVTSNTSIQSKNPRRTIYLDGNLNPRLLP